MPSYVSQCDSSRTVRGPPGGERLDVPRPGQPCPFLHDSHRRDINTPGGSVALAEHDEQDAATPCLDCADEFSKDRRESMSWIGVQAEFVVSTAQVLDECIASANHPGRAQLFEATHWSEPGFEPSVIGFDGVVGVLIYDVARRRQQLIEYPWVGGRPISGHLGGAWTVLQCAVEESASGRQIQILCDQDIDDLAILVDRPVQIAPIVSHERHCCISEEEASVTVDCARSDGERQLGERRREPMPRA